MMALGVILLVLLVLVGAGLLAVYLIVGIERLTDAERDDLLNIDSDSPWYFVFVVVPAVFVWPLVLLWVRRPT